MRNFLWRKWQNHNFGDRISFVFPTRPLFTCDRFDESYKNYKSFHLSRKGDLYSVREYLIILIYENLNLWRFTTDFESRHKPHFQNESWRAFNNI